jgi:Common central domain of tyrosinase
LYGTKYGSKDYFNRIHLYYGGSKSCDHWHQGPGFVTSHVTFSLAYEQSLQSINPSVTLPYWDFTLESTFFTPETFRYSGVFSEDWFGDPSCNNSDHTPTTGRFAYVPTMADAKNFSSLISPYGLLRSPVSILRLYYLLVG